MYLDAPIDAEATEVREESNATAGQALKDRIATPAAATDAPKAPDAPATETTTAPQAPVTPADATSGTNDLNAEIAALWSALPAKRVNAAAKAAGINISEGEEWEMAGVEKRKTLLSLLKAAK
jgi:hypothetical protein